MAIQKKVNGTWQPINPKQLKGIPYTGTLPAVLAGTKAGYLHRYKIYGDLSQNGTPTPENPIEPSECGERTENLFNQNESEQGDGYLPNKLITATGGTFTAAWGWLSEYISITPDTDYCFFSDLFRSGSYSFIAFYTAQKAFINTITKKYEFSPVGYVQDECTLFTTPENAYYMRVSIDRQSTMNLLTEGSTPPSSYIPYGYKLPLLSGSTPVDIYLGESQTTRRIKKLVLTGNEDIGYDSAYTRFSLKLPNCLLINVRRTPAFCTHYEVIDDGRAISNVPDNSMYSHNTESRWYIKTTDYSTADAFKAYLAQQYANGTPVTIWYVLAEPTTGTLNEPLRKIGDYADTVDSEQTTAQIPTTANSTTISWAGQGLEPSEFDSIQEWVDIPTYKRVNGEWVADT